VIDRRAPFVIDEAKFSTQRVVTYAILLIFAGVTAAVFWQNDPAERSDLKQAVINFTMLAIGFWLGSSKSSADKDASMSRIAESTKPPGSPITTDDVKIDAQTATVTTTTEGKP
jgi:hypothetical protein